LRKFSHFDNLTKSHAISKQQHAISDASNHIKTGDGVQGK